MAHTRGLGLGFAVWLLASSAFAQGVLAPGGGQLGSITVQEEDGSPTVSGVNKLKFANGSVTNNGDGSASIAGVSGLAATDIDTSLELKNIVTDETGSGPLVFGTAPTLDAPVITTKANFPRVTAMPGTPSAGDTVIVTDDSAAGACDSAAGSATTLCQYNGSAWVALGDGNSGSGAPTNATYIVQTANGSLSNEQALGALSTGCLGSATTTGVVSARTITGTANQITVTNGDCSGNPTLSISTNPTLPGTVSATAFTATGASTGIVDINGVTSGKLRLTTADATAQTVTVSAAAQTSGATTLTIPNMAGVSDTFLFAAKAATVTNKTYDAEGTGNVLTIPRRIFFPAAGCNNATAGSVWDLPTSNPAVAACKTGTNTQMGVLDFADGSNLSAQITYMLPTTWTGAVDANIKWLTSATTGNVVWQVSTICVADAETDDPAFNTASTVTDAAKGTTLQTNDAAISGVTMTGCAAGELLHLKIQRDSAHASDTLAATARLIGMELVIREAM